jgi:dynamin 1-like protein
LTLVDLPGMAKVAIGDQPEDIEDQIREMSLNYISNPNAIILAVTGANTDLANSDALKLAQAVDPYGNRTVGVITKLDLMDPGTDACDVLNNKVIPLRRGYIGVVNRGQIDVNNDLSIQDGLQKEETFFRTHPIYSRNRNISAKCGTRHLAKALNNMLMHHIRDCLPELKNRIAMMLSDVQTELDALGTPTESSAKSAVGGVLLGLLSKFAAHFGSIIDGKGGQTNTNTGTTAKGSVVNELFGGARISYIFTEIFASSLLSVGAFDGLSDEEIR